MCQVDVVAYLLVLYLQFCSTVNKNFFLKKNMDRFLHCGCNTNYNIMYYLLHSSVFQNKIRTIVTNCPNNVISNTPKRSGPFRDRWSAVAQW